MGRKALGNWYFSLGLREEICHFLHFLVSQLLPSLDKLSAICHIRKQSPPPIYKQESADIQYFRQVSPIRIWIWSQLYKKVKAGDKLFWTLRCQIHFQLQGWSCGNSHNILFKGWYWTRSVSSAQRKLQLCSHHTDPMVWLSIGS